MSKKKTPTAHSFVSEKFLDAFEYILENVSEPTQRVLRVAIMAEFEDDLLAELNRQADEEEAKKKKRKKK